MEPNEQTTSQDTSIPILVDEGAKDRCQHGSGRAAQCRFRVVDGHTFCANHLVNNHPRASLKRYRIALHHMRINELTKDKSRSLAEEIGMLTILLEEIWNSCHDNFDLNVNASRMESLIEKIAKLNLIDHKLQCATGQVVDGQTLFSFADELIKIVVQEVDNPETVARIAKHMKTLIMRAQDSAAAKALNNDE